MTIYELKAWTPEEFDLPADRAARIGGTGLVRVVALPGGRYRLEPDSRVGVALGDDWEVRVSPRISIPRLFFLIGYSRDQDGWRRLPAGFGKENELLSAVAAGFAYHATDAVRPGVLRGYVEREERLQGVRGRVRFGDQLARLAGLPLPLEVTYDDYTADIAENRMLRSAAEVLLRLRRVPARARTELLRLRAVLEEVSLLGDERDIRRPEETRLNKRYGPALALAELILKRSSITAQHGRVSATAFVFDMNEVFESFLSTSLSESLRRYGGSLEPQRVDFLDEDRKLRLRPDLTWRRRGKRLAVIDAKYKSLVDSRTMPNADAYQMLAYCIALGLPQGYLIYAKDSGAQQRLHRIRRHGYEVVVQSVDVELEPEALLKRVDAIAGAIAANAPSVAA